MRPDKDNRYCSHRAADDLISRVLERVKRAASKVDFESDLANRLRNIVDDDQDAKSILNEWIIRHSYIENEIWHKAVRAVFRSRGSDLCAVATIFDDTKGRLWEGLNRHEKIALGWLPERQDSGFWPSVIWRQSKKSVRECDLNWMREEKHGVMLLGDVMGAAATLPASDAAVTPEQILAAVRQLPVEFQPIGKMIAEGKSAEVIAKTIGRSPHKVKYLVPVVFEMLSRNLL